jgi:hypothetical protein
MTPTPSTANNDELITDLRKLDAHIAKAGRIRARRYEHLRQRLIQHMRSSKVGILKLSAARGFNKHRVTNLIYNGNRAVTADEWQVLFDFIDKENRRRERQRKLIESLAPEYND